MDTEEPGEEKKDPAMPGEVGADRKVTSI